MTLIHQEKVVSALRETPEAYCYRNNSHLTGEAFKKAYRACIISETGIETRSNFKIK